MATRKKTARPRDEDAEQKARERAPSGDSLNAYIREIGKLKPITPDEEKGLARSIQQGDPQALNRLVEANLRFVVSYAKRYRGLGLSFLDLIHEGNLGLIEAAKRFDPERNVKFISYAVWWVRQAIFHSLSEHTRVFRLPQKMSGQVSRLGSVRTRLALELERQPSTAELAKETQLSEQAVENLLRVSGDDISLSTAVGEEGSLELGDTLEQDSVPPVEEELIRSSFVKQMGALLEGLDEKERNVLRMRFGLDGEEPRTLQEIGDGLQLSRERIRQIESKAKEKLRRSRLFQGLRGYLN
jgi:RNA polymerase primary sigma factor